MVASNGSNTDGSICPETKKIIDLNDNRKEYQLKLDTHLSIVNNLSKQIGELFKNNKSTDANSLKKEVEDIKKQNPEIKVIAHPECPPDVISASDFAGSTSGMVKYVKEKQPKKVLLVTECSMSDNIQVENPNVEFVKPCNLCPYMKKITLKKIFNCLKNETNEIKIGNNIAARARKSVQRMAEIGR